MLVATFGAWSADLSTSLQASFPALPAFLEDAGILSLNLFPFLSCLIFGADLGLGEIWGVLKTRAGPKPEIRMFVWGDMNGCTGLIVFSGHIPPQPQKQGINEPFTWILFEP